MTITDPPYPLDAEVLGGPVDETFWRRHPHVLEVTIDTDDQGRQRTRLILAEAANDRVVELRKWAGAQRPEAEPDMRFENAGGAPPPWFWNEHPYATAYTLEHDPDDGGNWWVELWTRQA